MASSSDSLGRAVVIGPEEVRRCWSILNQCCEQVSAKAYCDDGLTRDFTSLETLLAYDNSISRNIHTLNMRGNGDKSADIQISTIAPNPVEIHLNCDESELHNIRRDLLELFRDARAWFSVFVKIRMEFIYVISIAVLWMTLSATSSGETSSGTGFAFTTALLFSLLLVGFIALLIYFGFVLAKVHDRYFPGAAFTLGHGQRRFGTDEKVRWGLFVAGGVSLMVGLTLWLMLPQ